MSTLAEKRLEDQIDKDLGLLTRMTKLLNRLNRIDHNTHNLAEKWEQRGRDHRKLVIQLREQWDSLTPEEREEQGLSFNEIYRAQTIAQDYETFAKELREARNVEP